MSITKAAMQRKFKRVNGGRIECRDCGNTLFDRPLAIVTHLKNCPIKEPKE